MIVSNPEIGFVIVKLFPVSFHFCLFTLIYSQGDWKLPQIHSLLSRSNEFFPYYILHFNVKSRILNLLLKLINYN